MKASVRWTAGTAALLILALASPATGYVPNTIEYVGGVPVITSWDSGSFPIPVRVTPGLTTDITDSSDRQALESALATWSAASGSDASVYLEREQDVEAGVADGINAIEFSNDAGLDGAQFTAITFLLVDGDGTISEADMLVNDREVGFTTTAGSDVGLDLETVMLKEFGKFLGLANSPVGGFETSQVLDESSSVMYAVARGIGASARVLQPDDVAGIRAMYPAAGSGFASISGTITRAGAAVFGAHVVAYDPIADILVGSLTLPDGSFRIDGLPAGRYLMEVLPLTAPVTPAAIGGIFTSEDVDTSFLRAFFGETIRLGAGQQASGLTLEVG
ncbi:MAG: hypothetical protein GKS06_18620 [Acidobacteria bacterium]|nr:hypothetical protein [Acidobacteriota bacterium]